MPSDESTADMLARLGIDRNQPHPKMDTLYKRRPDGKGRIPADDWGNWGMSTRDMWHRGLQG